MTFTPTIGDNKAPDEIELLRERLRETHQPLAERAAELAAMIDRLPEACDDDETAAKLADAIKSCTACTKNADAARVAAKEPFLASGRAVDGFFQNLAAPVEKVKLRMAALLTVYQRRKADEERRRREAEAAEQRRIAREAEEAARAARAAAKAAEEAQAAEAQEAARAARDAANAAQTEADKAREAARAKSADLSRSRTDLGSVASLRTTWAFEVEDPYAVPRDYLSVNEGAIRAAIKAATTKDGQCRLKIAGVRIYRKEESVVR